MITFALLRTLVSHPYTRKLAEYLGVALVVLALVFWFRPAPKPIVTHPNPTTTVVQVPVDHLTTKTVTKYVQDDTEVKRLLAENAKLHIQVTQLNETLAESTTHGTGPVTNVPTTSEPPVLQPSTAPNAIDFKDWRLHFVTDGTQARYELHQKFEVLNTTGRNADGSPLSTTKLFELGPDGQRLPIPTTTTTSVFADATRPHWSVHPTVTAGLGITTDKKPGGVVGVRWLTRGRTPSAEDSSLSLLTPALLLNADTKQIGILPVSVNLGRIKHQPFRDLWVSPFIGYDSTSHGTGKFAIVFHASF